MPQGKKRFALSKPQEGQVPLTSPSTSKRMLDEGDLGKRVFALCDQGLCWNFVTSSLELESPRDKDQPEIKDGTHHWSRAELSNIVTTCGSLN